MLNKKLGGSLIAAILLPLSIPSHGQIIDANLSNDSAEAQFKAPVGLNNFNKAYLQLGFLYNDDRKNNTLGNIGFEVSGAAGGNAAGLDLGAGINAYLGSVQEYDVGAITLGLMARYAPPIANRFAMTFRFNYAPDVTTFQDGEDLMTTNIRFGYEILPEVEIYTGYRRIEVGLKKHDDEVTVDNGWNIGVQLAF